MSGDFLPKLVKKEKKPEFLRCSFECDSSGGEGVKRRKEEAVGRKRKFSLKGRVTVSY